MLTMIIRVISIRLLKVIRVRIVSLIRVLEMMRIIAV